MLHDRILPDLVFVIVIIIIFVDIPIFINVDYLQVINNIQFNNDISTNNENVNQHGNKCVSFKNYSVSLISRTYSADYKRMRKWLLPTYHMFVDFNCIDIIFVFDNETEDYQVVSAMKQEYPQFKYYHEPLPENYEHVLNKHIFPIQNPRFGYDRQLWATFWLDNYTDSDIIGVIDSDAMIYSLITLSTILTSDAKIRIQSTLPDHFPNDSKVLEFDNFTYYDYMYPDRFPQWFWKDTFKNVRQWLMRKYHQTTFNDAYAVFSYERHCQFNIMYDYAMKFELERYQNYPFNTDNGVISVACNRCRENDIALGCCYNYGVCNKEYRFQTNDDFKFLWRYNNYKVHWKDVAEIVKQYNRSMIQKLVEMNQKDTTSKILACQSYLKQ